MDGYMDHYFQEWDKAHPDSPLLSSQKVYEDAMQDMFNAEKAVAKELLGKTATRSDNERAYYVVGHIVDDYVWHDKRI